MLHLNTDMLCALIATAVVIPRAKPWLWLLQKCPSAVVEWGSCSFCFGFWLGAIAGLLRLDGYVWSLGIGFSVSAIAGSLASGIGLMEAATDGLRAYVSEKVRS